MSLLSFEILPQWCIIGCEFILCFSILEAQEAHILTLRQSHNQHCPVMAALMFAFQEYNHPLVFLPFILCVLCLSAKIKCQTYVVVSLG